MPNSFAWIFLTIKSRPSRKKKVGFEIHPPLPFVPKMKKELWTLLCYNFFQQNFFMHSSQNANTNSPKYVFVPELLFTFFGKKLGERSWKLFGRKHLPKKLLVLVVVFTCFQPKISAFSCWKISSGHHFHSLALVTRLQFFLKMMVLSGKQF